MHFICWDQFVLVSNTNFKSFSAARDFTLQYWGNFNLNKSNKGLGQKDGQLKDFDIKKVFTTIIHQ